MSTKKYNLWNYWTDPDYIVYKKFYCNPYWNSELLFYEKDVIVLFRVAHLIEGGLDIYRVTFFLYLLVMFIETIWRPWGSFLCIF
jgi:hypothetical protein